MSIEALPSGGSAALPPDAPHLEIVVAWSAETGGKDIDAVALLLGPQRQVRSDADLVFYNQPADAHGCIRLLPRAHSAEGTSERITVDLDAIPADVTTIVFAFTVDGATTAEVAGLRVHVDDADDVTTLMSLDTAIDEQVSTLLFAELGRRPEGGWRISSRLQPWSVGLAALVTSFGVGVDDVAQTTEADTRVDTVSGYAVKSTHTVDTDEPGATAIPTLLGKAVEEAGDDLEVLETRRLPPDPRVMDAIGHNHDLATALADLVDNSLDAGAGDVRIRLMRHEGRVVRLLVVDDGRGIPDADLDRAMSVGAGRPYESRDLGHFGMGLKAAAFSQAGGLTVVSRVPGAPAAGRRWLQEKARADFACDVLTEQACLSVLEEAGLEGGGTVVRLDRLRRVPRAADVAVHRRFLSESDRVLRRHLGTVFHRFLDCGTLRLSVEVVDLEQPTASVPLPIVAVDPFSYRVSGAPGYPRALSLPGGTQLECHIWTPRSELTGFKFGTTRAGAFQGFYVYRNDRLLQVGGWNDLVAADNDLQLARVRVELDPAGAPGWRMSPQKDRVEWDTAVAQAITGAVGEDGATWTGYVDDAREAYRRGRAAARRRRRTLAPGRGFAPELRAVLEETFEHLPGQDPVNVRWRAFDDDTFLHVDRPERTLWLNQRYRTVLNGGRVNSLNDAPLLKAALYLLAEDLFQGHHHGPKDRDHLTILQEVLNAAALAELKRS